MSDQENRIVTDEVVVIGQKEETNRGGVDLSVLTKNRQVGERLSKKGSAPDDLGEGGGNGGFSLDINFSDFGSSDPGHTGSGSMFESVGLSNSGPPNIGSGGGTISPGYVLTKSINAPKKWDFKTNHTALVNGNLYSTLNEISRKTSNEVGFFLRYDSPSSKIFADFFVGNGSENWFGFDKNPYPSKVSIGANQMILGFVHKHNFAKDFSGADGYIIMQTNLGNYPWLNMPNSSSNTNPHILNRMFFGLVHPNGFDILSYKLTTPNGLSALYNNISLLYKGLYTVPNLTYPGFEYYNISGKP